MNDALFPLYVIVSFVVGSVWITFITVAADKWGSKIGGFIGGLPSTSIISFFFIGLAQSAQAVSEATTVFPLGYAVAGMFLITYALLAPRGFRAALSVSLTLWALLSALVLIFKVENFYFSLVVYVIVSISSFFILEKKLRLKSFPKIKTSYSKMQILWRAIFSGTVIAAAVVLSKLGGPIFGGMFAAFPAAFISTVVITYINRGLEFSRAMTKPLMFTGMITIILYGIAVRYFYIDYGVLMGTVFALIVSLASAYLTYIFLQKRIR